MNIKQRIVLVIGGIVLALVIFITLEPAPTSSKTLETAKEFNNTLSHEAIEAVYLLLKNDCIIAILRSVIVAALTFSAYIGFKSRD